MKRAGRNAADEGAFAAADLRPALPAIAVPRLFLWRHGRTEWNAAGRFQGYFELMEMEMMQRAGMTPAQVLAASTRAFSRGTSFNTEMSISISPRLIDGRLYCFATN